MDATDPERSESKFGGLAFDEKVRFRQKLKAKLEAMEADFKAATADLRDGLVDLDVMISFDMDAMGVTTTRTVDGWVPYFSRTENYEVTDRMVFFDWVRENDGFDVLTNHVSKEAIRSRGEIPDGIQLTIGRRLNIKKATK